jgi:acyl carrier protein
MEVDTDMASEPLTFDQFCDQLSTTFQVPRAGMRADTAFVEDLGFDSLRMLNLGLLFESLQVDMRDDLAWDIRTVADAYRFYTAHLLPLGGEPAGLEWMAAGRSG